MRYRWKSNVVGDIHGLDVDYCFPYQYKKNNNSKQEKQIIKHKTLNPFLSHSRHIIRKKRV